MGHAGNHPADLIYLAQMRVLRMLAAIAASLVMLVPIGTSSASATEPVPDVSTNIVGGYPANRAETPWFVLVNPNIGGNYYLCGGTAISQQWVVTAAHCVTRSNGARMTPSEISSSYLKVNPESINSGMNYAWSNVIVHPDWNPQMDTNDIALIQVAHIPATPLPYSSDTSGPTAGTTLSAYGFGALSYGGPISAVLRQGNVLDLSGVSGPCGNYGNYYNNATQLCAGTRDGGTDSCQGDSGGPLTTMAAGQRVLVGVVSWGYECARAGYPGIYTRVAQYANWIRGATGVGTDSNATGIRTPGKLNVGTLCGKTKICKLKKGAKALTLRVDNSGGTAVTTKLTFTGGVATNRTASVGSGATMSFAIKAKNSKAKCSKLTVTSNGAKVKQFRISANNAKRC